MITSFNIIIIISKISFSDSEENEKCIYFILMCLYYVHIQKNLIEGEHTSNVSFVPVFR